MRTSSTSLTRQQVPLKLGWATTVHRAQGMSLTRAEVHWDDAWAGGQVYTGLSRVTCTAGLRISGQGLRQSSTHCNPVARRFYDAALTSQAKRRWHEHATAALESSGGAMKWRRLRHETVQRWREAEGSGDATYCNNSALAHLPRAWLSTKDEYVRLPQAT